MTVVSNIAIDMKLKISRQGWLLNQSYHKVIGQTRLNN